MYMIPDLLHTLYILCTQRTQLQSGRGCPHLVDVFLSLNLSLLALRNDDGKRASFVWRTVYGNIPIVSPGNSPGKTQAQPGARLRPAGIAAIKSFKNVREILF